MHTSSSDVGGQCFDGRTPKRRQWLSGVDLRAERFTVVSEVEVQGS
jgi:hypothetical protein